MRKTEPAPHPLLRVGFFFFSLMVDVRTTILRWGRVDPPESIPLSSSSFSSPLASVLFDDAGSALGPGAPFSPTERGRRQIAPFFSPLPHFLLLLLPFPRSVKTTVDPVKGEKKGEGRQRGIHPPLFLTWAGQQKGKEGENVVKKKGK